MEAIESRLKETFRDVVVYSTKALGDTVRYIKENGRVVDLIIVAGGDGTVSEAVNALCSLDKRPVFAILPGGTSNDFSRAIGMDQDPIAAVEQLTKQEIRSLDIGQTDNQYFSNFWGIGLITQVSANINGQAKEWLGRMSYYISAAQNIGNNEPFALRVQSNDYHFEGEASMFVVGNGPFTGGISAFFPQSDITDGLLDVLIIKKTSLKTLWSIVQSKVANEFPTDDEGIIYFQTDRLTVSAQPKQQIDCDGERRYHTPADISVLPNQLQMIVGDMDKLK